MKKIDLIKKISKIIFLLSISFSAIYGVISYKEILLVEKTTNGSAQAVDCKIKVSDFQENNKLDDNDPQLMDLLELCDGISSQRIKMSISKYK